MCVHNLYRVLNRPIQSIPDVVFGRRVVRPWHDTFPKQFKIYTRIGSGMNLTYHRI